MAKKATLTILCLTLIITFSSTAALADISEKKSKDELVFGILPFLSPVALLKRFSPLKDYLEKTTGKKIIIESAPSFPEYVKRTLNHEYDLVYTAPHFVPLTLEDSHYELLAASNNISSHIIVNKSSAITRIEQLAGKRIAHGPDQAFLVIIAKYLLKSKGLTGDKAPVFISHKSHNAALRANAAGDADAAIVGTFHLKLAAEKGLKAIEATERYPGIGILASREMPKALQHEIAKAFIDIKKSAEGRDTLKKIRFPGFKQTIPADYDSLKPVAADAFDKNSFRN